MTTTDQNIAEDQEGNLKQFEGVDTPLGVFIGFLRVEAAVMGFIVIVGIILLAVFAPILTPTDPYDLTSVTILDSRLAPGEAMMSGTVAYLGTDVRGRDGERYDLRSED